MQIYSFNVIIFDINMSFLLNIIYNTSTTKQISWLHKTLLFFGALIFFLKISLLIVMEDFKILLNYVCK